MTSSSKLQTINTSVVDKLPSTRLDFFGKDKGDRETISMTTDKAKKGDDETSYRLDEKSTIEEEEEETAATATIATQQTNNLDVLSMSANSSANFSFATHDNQTDAYPALYNPEVQAAYEKMKIEEEEKREQEKRWGPVMSIIGAVKSGVNKLLSYLESLCADAESLKKS